MDRIDRFLNSRPSKKKRVVRVGKKKIEVTKEDVKKVRRYLNRECLDEIDLCTPMDTRYSSIPGVAVVKVKKDISESLQKYKIEKIKQEKRKNPVVQRPTRRWDILECEGGAEFTNLQSYDREKNLSEYIFGTPSLMEYYKELESLYLRPRMKEKRIKIDRLEKEPRFPSKEVKTFCFGADGPISGSACVIGLGDGDKNEIWEMKRGFPIGKFEGERALFLEDDLFFVQGNRVLLRNVLGSDEVVFEAAVRKKTGEEFSQDEKRAEIVGISVEKDRIALLSRNSVCLVDRHTKRRRNFSVPGAKRVAIRNGKVYALALNSLFVFDPESHKKTVTKGGHGISVGDVAVLATDDHVVVEGRRMYQGGFVRYVQAHQRRPLFCAVTAEELRLFCYEKRDGGLSIRLCKRVPGRFDNPAFHPQHPWLYVLRDGRTRIYA